MSSYGTHKWFDHSDLDLLNSELVYELHTTWATFLIISRFLEHFIFHLHADMGWTDRCGRMHNVASWRGHIIKYIRVIMYDDVRLKSHTATRSLVCGEDNYIKSCHSLLIATKLSFHYKLLEVCFWHTENKRSSFSIVIAEIDWHCRMQCKVYGTDACWGRCADSISSSISTSRDSHHPSATGASTQFSYVVHAFCNDADVSTISCWCCCYSSWKCYLSSWSICPASFGILHQLATQCYRLCRVIIIIWIWIIIMQFI